MKRAERRKLKVLEVWWECHKWVERCVEDLELKGSWQVK